MKRLMHMFRRNDIIVRIYLSFVVVLALTVTLIGVIFLKLYENNYMRSYTETLSRQGEVIAKRVGKLARKEKMDRFSKYAADIDELQRADEIDVWIVSNDKASRPLTENYTNADTASLTDEMYDVLEQAFQGEKAHNSNFDKIYGMVILRIAIPVYIDKASGEVAGAPPAIRSLCPARATPPAPRSTPSTAKSACWPRPSARRTSRRAST